MMVYFSRVRVSFSRPVVKASSYLSEFWMLLDDKLDPLSKDPNRLKQRIEVFRFKVEDRSPDAGVH